MRRYQSRKGSHGAAARQTTPPAWGRFGGDRRSWWGGLSAASIDVVLWYRGRLRPTLIRLRNRCRISVVQATMGERNAVRPRCLVSPRSTSQDERTKGFWYVRLQSSWRFVTPSQSRRQAGYEGTREIKHAWLCRRGGARCQ